MKTTSLFIAFLMLVLTSGAQSGLGVKAGVNFPDLVGKSATSNLHNKTGYYAGGLLYFRLGKQLRLQPEVILSNAGYKYSELGGNFSTTFTYLNIPLLLQYVQSGFCLETGVQAGALLIAKRKGGSIGDEDIRDSFKSRAFSCIAGFGYRHSSGFGIDLRYTAGFGSISSASNLDANFDILMLGISKTFK